MGKFQKVKPVDLSIHIRKAINPLIIRKLNADLTIMKKGIRKIIEAVHSFAGLEAFDLAIILGSGLDALTDRVEDTSFFSYRDFPCFPPVTVTGHAGRLIAGNLQGWRVLIFQGRHHLYEGYNARQITVPVRVARELGCPRLLLTNAAGAINSSYRTGDFMYIADHINFMGDNPLRGATRNPFVDLSELYEQRFFPSLLKYAGQKGIGFHRGILAALPGPSYETPAEIRALRLLGADSVSMSTIPEAIMGKYLEMEVAGLSFISNAAAGLSALRLNHNEVLEAGRKGSKHLSFLVRELIDSWQGKGGSGQC
jgi:purine-nucleoside phosphorylase